MAAASLDRYPLEVPVCCPACALLFEQAAATRPSDMTHEQSERVEALADIHVRILAGLMGLLSLPLLLLLLLTPLAMARLIFDANRFSADDQMMAAFALPLGLMLGLYGAFLTVVAVGLWRRRRWAGLFGTIVCISWFPLGLLPFGVYGLYALLRRKVRDSWSPGRPPRASLGTVTV